VPKIVVFYHFAPQNGKCAPIVGNWESKLANGTTFSDRILAMLCRPVLGAGRALNRPEKAILKQSNEDNL
jgi:hypothetical protein